MQTNSEPESSSKLEAETTTHYPRYRTVNLLLGMLTLLVVASYLWMRPPALSEVLKWMRIILIVEFSFVSALSFLRAWRQRIVTSPEGIEYYAPALFRIRTRWENIERVGTTPRYGWGRVEGLVLDQPGFQGPGWLLSLPWIKAQASFIPLGQSFESWRYGRLGQAIRRYAPHLLEPPPAAQASGGALPPRTVQYSGYRNLYRALAWLLGTLGIIGVLAIFLLTMLEPDGRMVMVRWFTGFLLIIFIALIGLASWMSTQMYLVASAQGVEYHQPGYSIQTAWDNIERIGQVPVGWLGILSSEGLMLRQSSLHVSKGLTWSLGPLRAGTFIPLQEYTLWRNQALGRYIQQYAPHLLTQTNADPGG